MPNCSKHNFFSFLCLFLVSIFMINLIGCGGSGGGSKYIPQTPISGDEKIIASHFAVEPARKLEIADGSIFNVSIPSESFSSRYSIEVTKADLNGKDDAEKAVEGKNHGLPEGYLPASSFYNIRIKVTEMPVVRAAIAMNTAVLLNKQASILLASLENLDWEANDYYIAVLEGSNGKEAWYLVPASKTDVTGSNAFQMESNSLGKSYCIVKKVKTKPTPVDPTPVDPTPEPKVVVNSVALSAEPTSIDTDETKKFTKDISVCLKVSYTGNLDSKSMESLIKLFAFSNFEFSSEVKATNEGGLYYYTSQLTNHSSGASEITYVFTIPAKGQEYNKAKHPANLFVDVTFTLEGIDYRPKQPLSITLVAPAEPLPTPEVVAVSPIDGATDLATNTTVVFTFSEEMENPLAENAFTLTVGGISKSFKEVFGIQVSGKSISLQPISSLSNKTTYVITATTDLLAKNGKALSESKTLTFTTVKGPDPVTAIIVEPTESSGLWVDQKFVVVFDQPMDTTSVQEAFGSESIKKENVTFEWFNDNRRLVVTPKEGALRGDQDYEYKIAVDGVKSETGIPLEKKPITVSFSTRNFKNGSGEVDDPYEIYTAADLDNVRNYLNKHFIQMADINLIDYGDSYDEGRGWEPIGDYKNDFAGSYDGGGHKVTNLFINRPNKDYVGLFGYANGKISYLGVKIADTGVTGRLYVGGLVGYETCDISNCYAIGKVSGANGIGGLVGQTSGNISNCYATCQVNGSVVVGGLVGESHRTISNCYATGQVTGDSCVGGLVGESYETISNCYALNSSLSSGPYYGRVCKKINLCTLTNCYANADMLVNGAKIEDDSEKGLDHINGKDVSKAEYLEANWWKGTGNFVESIWLLKDGELPTLKNCPE